MAKVFVSDATGTLGRRLVPLLVAKGHEVTAMTRSPAKAGPLRAAGAEPVVADGLDRAAVEAKVTAVGGTALRYANFYGPGTGFAWDGDIVALARQRKPPIVGDGAGVWSFVHLDDAASATLAAIERGAAGIYNIVDDEPAPACA
jgi:nucleoside-diphosphate-sugar epimerase